MFKIVLHCIFVKSNSRLEVDLIGERQISNIKTMEPKTIYQVNGEDLISLFRDFQEQLEASKEKEEHYTRQEAERITGKSRTTLYLWEQQGYLTPVRMGKTLLYLKSDIDRIMNTKRKD